MTTKRQMMATDDGREFLVANGYAKRPKVTRLMRRSLAPWPLAEAYERAGQYARAAVMFRRAHMQAGGHGHAARMEVRFRDCLVKAETLRGKEPKYG